MTGTATSSSTGCSNLVLADDTVIIPDLLVAPRRQFVRKNLPGTHPRAGAAERWLGDALLEMARATLDRQAPDQARRSRSRLTAQVDPVSGWARLADGELFPPTSLSGVSSLAQVMKSLPGRVGAPRLRPLTAADLTRLDLGRSSRQPNQALRDLLGAVDGERCRFPGCTRHRKLPAHHVRFWSDGGATDLGNLVNREYDPAYEAR